MHNKILIIDDEPDIRTLIKYNLKKEDFIVEEAENGEEGIKKALSWVPDLIILDVMMPVMDGMETCELLRKEDKLKDSLIVFLTARTEDYSQIAGLDAGADDYISKPIKPKLLISKINAILRRQFGQADNKNDAHLDNDIVIDRNKYLVYFDNKELSLPRKEFELLALLYDNIEHVCTRELILDKIWGTNVVVGDRTIDVHIRKLREKFGDKRIQTVKGIGYKFKLPVTVAEAE
ncbi:DNA-binding response regulator [Putridiphycobacter roseus]|uniref:DNA-binding response regulator n=1 Tax=Putridiphycobacter roseus TaxID=2219161 RepID=A0A2W1N4W4_9FLAO|nr:response regulator transcription factor [Putridiphycobacter roseus]PZE18620.1 DNA-binding response regulator [Putridiphycobacter roseus]